MCYSKRRYSSDGHILRPGECQRSNKRYQYSKMVRGERITVYDTNLKNLRQKERNIDKLMWAGRKSLLTRSYTLDAWFTIWLKQFTTNTKTSTKSRYYNDYYGHISGPIGHYLLEDISLFDCQRIIGCLINKGLANRSVRNIATTMRRIFDAALANGLIERSPMGGAQLPRDIGNIRDAIPKHDLELFFRFVEHSPRFSRLYPIFRTLLNTGMRAGELCALTPQDIDFSHNIIHVNKTAHYCRVDEKYMHFISSPKSPKSIRDIPMNDEVSLIMHTIIENNPIDTGVSIPVLNDNSMEIGSLSDFIFRNEYNTAYSVERLGVLLTAIFDEMDMNEAYRGHFERFVLHRFRHTFTSICYENGIDIVVVSRILGHEKTSTTMNTYAHLSEAFETEAYDKIRSLQIA